MTEQGRSRDSRFAGFHRMTRDERLGGLVARGFLTAEAAQGLAAAGTALPFATANTMIENVIGCFELPIGVAPNFRVNGRDYVVPMVVEEPSIVAAVSHIACLVRGAGGFTADADPPVMTGQVQVVGLADVERAADALRAAEARLVALANEAEPGMARRGGGAQSIEVRVLGGGSRYTSMVVLHLYVDVRDAMGANLINTMCEAVAPEVEALTGGRVVLRILSNLTDRRRVRASCRIPFDALAWQGYTGAEIAAGVADASAFAEADPYRAATHNKGIMNGIDAAAIALGQDWRAIEAGAHAYAARDGRYGPMARWWVEEGALVGALEVPMAVGTVGGPIRLHPTVTALLAMLDVGSAGELACVLGSVGLAQNLGALKALASTGIQRGHMALHARSVAATAGAEGDEADAVAAQLVREGRIKVERAREVLAGLRLYNAPRAD